MKIIIPMAGRGSRFAQSSYNQPKPLIDVLGRPMFTWALKSISNIEYSELIFIALKEHEHIYNVTQLIDSYVDVSYKLVLLDNVTDGQLCTVLTAKKYIDNNEDILIIASDTVIKTDLTKDIMRYGNQLEGLISVLKLPGEQWSFARSDSDGKVIQVAEKNRISDWASTGMYYFKNGSRFVKEAELMILNEEKTRGEYYIMPVYQKLINSGMDIRISIAENMWDMGTPEGLAHFINNYHV